MASATDIADQPTSENASITPRPFEFVHLHLHTEYSLIDGTIRTGKALAKAKAWGHKAMAITDSGNLFGAVEFYTKAKGEGVKAIIGCEIFFEGHAKTHAWAESQKHEWPVCGAYHLVLLCKNNQGYKNLCKIVSLGYTEGLKEIPIVHVAHLESSPGDMIALSGDIKSELSYLTQELRKLSPTGALPLGDYDDPALQELNAAIAAHVEAMHRYVGEGNYYVELIDNNLKGQRAHLRDLVTVANYFNLPLVCSADAHYIDQSFSQSYSVFVAIKAGVTFKDLRQRNKSARFHLLSNEEIQDVYGEWPDAIANTVKIAAQCDVKFEFGKYYLPKFPVPEGMTAGDYLDNIAKRMLEERFVHLAKVYGSSFDDARKQVYRDRLAYEVKVIQNMGFPGYFLIVQDFINWAKQNGIPVGPGRGSGAGSLVAYALRITDLDPLRFNLLFERFLNPERISMPDFDVDFCQDRRGEVIDYVTEKYGKDHVAQIATFGKMKAKLAIRDVARVMELSYGRADKIAKLIPNKVPNEQGEEVEATIPLAMKVEPRLQEEADKDSVIADVLKITADLEGLNRQTGTHAAGVVMSDGPMTDYVPVFTDSEGGLITQYEMKNAEKVGLVKFDFLGLKTLTVIDRAMKLIHAQRAPDFDIDTIDLEDKKVYRDISEAFTIGVFQLEGEGMMQLIKKLQPSCFEDIIALVALFRPGPLGSGMVDDFIERKHGRQEIQYPLPQLEGILKETYGVILYQEQVQKTAVVLANYTPGEADLLRRAMGKKIKSEMDAQRARFLKGAEDNQLNPEKSGEIFDLMAKFAEYGFNKSHSAAYGLVAYQTAYLKTHFRDLFMAAIMTCDLDRTDKVIRYAEDCLRMRIKVLSPNINASLLEFSVPEKDVIRWGLSAIKGIGAPSVKTLVEERLQNGPYKSLADIAKRVNLQASVGKKTLELLIKSGGLDSFGMTREHLLSIVADLVKFSDSVHSSKKRGQRSLFDLNDNSESGSDNADHDVAPAWVGVMGAQVPITLESLEEERKLLGIYLSGHPIHFYSQDVQRFGKCFLNQAFQLAGKGNFAMVAILQGVQERMSKTGAKLCYITLDDQSGTIEAMMGEKDIPPAFPPPGTPVVVQAKVSKLPDGTISTRVRITKVITLEEVRQQSIKKFTITIDARPGATAVIDVAERVRRIKEAIGSRGGPADLKFEMIYPDATVALTANKGVELTNKLLRSVMEASCGGRYG